MTSASSSALRLDRTEIKSDGPAVEFKYNCAGCHKEFVVGALRDMRAQTAEGTPVLIKDLTPNPGIGIDSARPCEWPRIIAASLEAPSQRYLCPRCGMMHTTSPRYWCVECAAVLACKDEKCRESFGCNEMDRCEMCLERASLHKMFSPHMCQDCHIHFMAGKEAVRVLSALSFGDAPASGQQLLESVRRAKQAIDERTNEWRKWYHDEHNLS